MRVPNYARAFISTRCRRLDMACGYQPALDDHPDGVGKCSSYPGELKFMATPLPCGKNSDPCLARTSARLTKQKGIRIYLLKARHPIGIRG